jgi:hemoglobin
VKNLRYLLLMLATTVGAVQPHNVVAQQRDNATPATLYSRLGGYDFIARFVDTAFPRVASHPQLSRLFRGHSQDSQMRQRQLIVDILCHGTGGPCVYIGRDMTTVHKGLGITDEDWQAFMTVITRTLEEFELPKEAQQEFIRLFEERFRSVVVVGDQ